MDLVPERHSACFNIRHSKPRLTRRVDHCAPHGTAGCQKDKLELETKLREKATAGNQQSLALLQQTEQAFNRLIPHQLLQLLEREHP